MASESNEILELAQRIVHNAQMISTAFNDSNIKPPSSQGEEMPSWPTGALEVRSDLQENLEKLQRLVVDPLESMVNTIVSLPNPRVARAKAVCIQQAEVTVPHVIVDFGLAQAVPLGGTSEYSEIADASGLPEREVRRVLKCAMLDGIFRETSSGTVAHTYTSRLLAEDRNLADWANFWLEMVIPAKLKKTATALRQSPGSEDARDSGFTLASGSNLYEYLATHPAKAKAFKNGMATLQKRGGYEVEHLIKHLPPQSSLHQGGICVDVGGSNGGAMFALVRALPNARCVVQDLPGTIDQQRPVPDEFRGRIEFMAYDFFTPQPVAGAAVYLLRNILHNWSDTDCTRIIRRISAVMGDTSRLVINDWCLTTDDSMHRTAMNRTKRRMDLGMLTLFNSRERDINEFTQLLKDADPRLFIDSIEHPSGSNYSVIVARKR